MTHFIIVRHGESEGNAKGEFHGQYNSDLTERGHAQAECTACFVDRYTIDVLYASDIRRAFSTAGHTAERRGMTVTPEEGLREIYAGAWEQMRFDDIAVRYAEAYRVWHEDIANARPTDGESVAELAVRVNAAFVRLARENDGKTVYVATHATPIRAMRCLWTDGSISAMKDTPWAPNASVTTAVYDGAFHLTEYGYADHLEHEGLLTALPKKI